MRWIKDHYMLFALSVVLFLEGEWSDLKSLYGFVKDPENLKIEEVDFDLYDNLEEDLWK
jgi:hypothetical protein